MKHIFMVAALGLAFTPMAHAESYNMGDRRTISVTVKVVEIGNNAVYVNDLNRQCEAAPQDNELCGLLLNDNTSIENAGEEKQQRRPIGIQHHFSM